MSFPNLPAQSFPQYNLGNVHYDQYLTNISVAYRNPNEYIAEQVIPVVEVLKQSDRYMVFDYQDDKIEDLDIRRAPGTVASEVRTGWSDDAFYAQGYAKRTAIYDEEIANADQDRIYNLLERGAQLTKDKLMLAKEISASATLTNPNNFHSDLSVSFGSGGTFAKWSDFNNSDPMKDVFKLKEKAERLGSPMMNTLILSKPVYNILKFHPKLKATIAGFISPMFVPDDVMKQLFDVDNIIVANARKATTAQRKVGQGGMTNYVWGNNAVLMYLPEGGAGREIPATAYTFQWTNPQANVTGLQKTRSYMDEASKTTWVETEEWYSHKVVSKVSAVVLPDVVDPWSASI